MQRFSIKNTTHWNRLPGKSRKVFPFRGNDWETNCRQKGNVFASSESSSRPKIPRMCANSLKSENRESLAGLEAILLVNSKTSMTDISTISSGKRPPKATSLIAGRRHDAVSRIAESDSPVLIAGEHGVGKRSIAAEIHAMSSRSRRSFAEIESANADTQAVVSAIAGKGTVYFAQVENLSLSLQKLIIDSYLYMDWAERGRLLCGSSCELLDQVRLGRIREDFYYLISGVTLRIFPLRFRKSEIISIADELLTHYSRQFDRPKPVLREEIVGYLMEHSWPDNLSELDTAIKTFAAIGDQSISLAALKAQAATSKTDGQLQPVSLKQASRAASSQVERHLIAQVLVATGGNRKRAADKLGISYKALLYKIKQAGAESQPASNGNGVHL
jgi:two-component system response regulator AtoC